jgi:hypothetical protein
MKRQLGIFASDQITRAQTVIPASALMAAEEGNRLARLQQNLPAGVPTHIQHDLHRQIGWSRVLGHMIDGSMVRAIGQIDEVETDEEKQALKMVTDTFWKLHHEEGMELIKLELSDLLQPLVLDQPRYLQIEAFVVSSPGLAAQLYPSLFDEKSNAVDKDGLTDYRTLTTRMKLVHPGVFHDVEKGLIIFAHRFFRRSLSHKNKLNEYFLQSFHQTAADFSELTPRIRLDPDLIGHPATVTNLMELEHWHGPKFSDDIESIRAGATEYKASDRTRFYEGVDRTHFWWKSPEAREVDGKQVLYRTSEVEELIDNISGGLEDDRYGCRYTHAEFSPAASAITHFDGAIRAYCAEAYLERIETQIDHAGKHSDYTKLFRFDGSLPVERWKRLMSDYFRGNPLVPEYLGISSTEFEPSSEPTAATAPDADEADLSALISLARNTLEDRLTLGYNSAILPVLGRILTIETGCEAIDAFLRTQIDLSQITALGSIDGVLNLSRIGFGSDDDFSQMMTDIVEGIASALPRDIVTLSLQRVAISLTWPFGELMVTLSLRGEANLVSHALSRLLSVVDPTKAPSEWIEPLSELVQVLAPRSTPVNEFWGVTEGVLECEHSEEVRYRMILPDAIAAELVKRGGMEEEGPRGGSASAC